MLYLVLNEFELLQMFIRSRFSKVKQFQANNLVTSLESWEFISQRVYESMSQGVSLGPNP